MSVVTAGCEGGCGVTLSVDGCEVLDDVTTVYRHTVARCRVIRTLREAGQAAAGGRGTCVVRVPEAWPSGFAVLVSRTAPFAMATVWVQVVVAGEVVWSHYPRLLDSLGAGVEEQVRAALDRPWEVPGEIPPAPVLARDPYAGRT